MKTLKNRFQTVLIHLPLIFLALCCLLPFSMILSTSLSSKMGFLKNGYTLIPMEINIGSYYYLFKNPGQILSAYATTIFVCVVGVSVGILFMTGYAYALSRSDNKLRGFLSFYIYFTMLFSGGMVATYMWFTRYLHLRNNILVLILPFLMNAWNIFILRTGCKSVPFSLIETAKLEGAGEFRIFFTIVVPLAKTSIATMALLMLFTYWNEWQNSLLYMDDASRGTIQFYLMRILNSVNFAKQNNSGGLIKASDLPDDGMQMAICTLTVAPMMLVFPFFQKYFVKGITVGSVKG